MEENPLDLEQHEEESLWDVWKRRLMFGLLIALCITFAAPTFSSCSGALGSGGSELVGSYQVGDVRVDVSRADFDTTWQRLAFTMRLMGAGEPETKEQVWAHILRNAAAEEAGVHIPSSRVGDLLASREIFQRGGAFDEGTYRAVLQQSTNSQLTPRAFTRTLEELLRVQEYLGIYQAAFEIVPSREAYERWRDRAEKLSVTYVVQPFSGVEDEVAALEPTDAELRTFAQLPQAADRLRVEARKTVEAAYFLVRDMTDEQVAELERRLRADGRLRDDVDVLGLQVYHGAKNAIFTRENWLRAARVEHAADMEAYRAELAEWEKLPEETRGEKPPEPPDPALESVPEDFIEQYRKFWRPRIVREVLAREFLRTFAEQAERENRSFADLAEDYVQLGVHVVQNEEPLADSEMAERFPEKLGQESELPVTVRSLLRGPSEGATFTPDVHTEPVPTTNLGHTLDDRGYMVLRLAGYEPSRVRDVSEARDVIVEMWREHTIRERAKARLEAVRDRVLDGGTTLEASAAESGLEVRTLRRFNRSTEERRMPPTAPGTAEDEATRSAREALRHRNRIVRDYAILSGIEVGQLRPSILLDDLTEAAYLVRMDEKHVPGPREIGQAELQAERITLMQETFQTQMDLQSFETLARRYRLDLREPEPAQQPAEGGDDDTGAD